MSSGEASSPIRMVNETATSLNEAVGDMIKTSTNNLSNLARKILNLSATSLSVAFAGVVGFVIYRSYKSHGHIVSQDNPNQTLSLSDIVDPDLTRIKKSPDQIEEVVEPVFSLLIPFSNFLKNRKNTYQLS
jgi:hypothetical protein